MRHDEIIECGKGTQDQCCAEADEARRLRSPGCQVARSPLWDIQKSGLPVYPGSKDRRERTTCSWAKDGFHCQTVTETDRRSTTESASYGKKHKRYRHTGSGSISLQGLTEWPKERTRSGGSNLNTSLTAWRRSSSSRLITFWFPIRFVLLDRKLGESHLL